VAKIDEVKEFKGYLVMIPMVLSLIAGISLIALIFYKLQKFELN